jgi:hypothetical protein
MKVNVESPGRGATLRRNLLDRGGFVSLLRKQQPSRPQQFLSLLQAAVLFRSGFLLACP